MTSILIIGAGALGSFLAASIAASGHNVTVVARGARGEHLRRYGIDLERSGRRDNIPVAVHSHCSELGRPDIAILCTKGGDLAAALDLLQDWRDDPPIIVTVQNGVEAPDQACLRFPRAAVLAARVHGFFELDGAGVRHVGVEPSVLFGGWSGGGGPAEQQLFRVLTAAGIGNDVSSDIRRDLWEKLLLASAIGGVGAALAIPVGQIIAHPEACNMLEAAMREVAALASTRGIALPESCVETTLAFVAGFPASATSSLQRDLEAGRPSEFDQLTGAVIRMAGQEALDVPVHRRIAAMLADRGLLVRPGG